MPRTLLICWLSLLMMFGLHAASKPTEHKCKGSQDKQGRQILEQEDAKDVRLLTQEPVTLPESCKVVGYRCRWLIEVIIDEKGDVECAEVISDVKDTSTCMVDAVRGAVRKFKFSIPKDSNGKAVACYAIFTMNIDPTR